MKARRTGGMRGGLALQPPPAAPRAPQAVAPPAPVSAGDAAAGILPGDLLVPPKVLWQRMQWTVVFAGFLLYVFVATTYQLRVGDIAVAVALFGLLLQREPFRFPRFLIWFAVFLLWCAVGYLTTRYPISVWNSLDTLFRVFLITLVAVNALRTRDQVRLFIVFWVLCFALYPARGAILNYLGGYTHFGRALWNFIYSNPNDLAALTLLQLSLATGLLVTEPKGIFRFGALGAVIVLPIVILLTQSRAVFLGLALFGVLALLVNRQRLRTLALLLVLGLAILFTVPSSTWERFGGLRFATNRETLRAVDKEGSAEQRFQIWETALAIIRDHPITGVGFGAYPQAHFEYAPVAVDRGINLGKRDTHSTYLNVTAAVGFPGLLVFLGLVAAPLVYAERVRRRVREWAPRRAQQLFFLEVGLLGFLVAGIFASYAKLSFLYLHLALIFAVASVLEREHAEAGGVSAPAAR